MRWILLLAASAAACRSGEVGPAELGQKVFFDPALSNPTGQACADCHAPEVAFRDPESDHSTSRGVLVGHFGLRNAPTLMYARYVPDLHQVAGVGWVGGLFWDGRGGNLEHQAGFPLLNPVEMNNPDKARVASVARAAAYAGDFRALYGTDALQADDSAFAHVAQVIAAYERTEVMAPFTSKYDAYLAGKATLSASEQRGLAVFEDPKRGDCAGCHPSRAAADGTPPLFTNFSYANLGIPRYGNSGYFRQGQEINPSGEAFIDHGLMETVKDPAQDGKFRTPTLRNIKRTGPYGHNGYFQNLPYILDFLNTRDSRSPDPNVKPWSPPEVAANVEQRVGHLGLTAQELEDLASFLETLTDAKPKVETKKK